MITDEALAVVATHLARTAVRDAHAAFKARQTPPPIEAVLEVVTPAARRAAELVLAAGPVDAARLTEFLACVQAVHVHSFALGVLGLSRELEVALAENERLRAKVQWLSGPPV